MTDVAYPGTFASSTASRFWQFVAILERSLRRAMMACDTRRALDELPDSVLKDIGIARSEIPFIAGALVSADTPDPCSRSKMERHAAAPIVSHAVFCLALVITATLSALAVSSDAVLAQDAQVKRGQYLVTFGGCNDCHTPGYFFGKPDKARFLAGSEVGFEIPGLGVFYGPNLTPDNDTGLGKWSVDDIVTAVTTGQRPDGRILAPVMPWHAFAKLTDRDVRAIAAFLKSLPPVKNKVPGPFGPSEKPTSFVMKIVPPDSAATGESAPK